MDGRVASTKERRIVCDRVRSALIAAERKPCVASEFLLAGYPRTVGPGLDLFDLVLSAAVTMMPITIAKRGNIEGLIAVEEEAVLVVVVTAALV